MNFWTPTFDSWGHGLDWADMPWYVLYDYVEVYKYDSVNDEFVLHWRDDFEFFDTGRWHKAEGSFPSNSSNFHPSNVYTSEGNLVLKMEPEHDHAHHALVHHDVVVAEPVATEVYHYANVGKNFPRETLHAKEANLSTHGEAHHVASNSEGQQSDDIEIPPVHDAFVDSHLFGKHDIHLDKHLIGSHGREYIKHHDDYYVDEHGRVLVDHRDKKAYD